ncbi:MAG: PAS domain S-box protein [Methanolinea sp.]|nr:PAS domain S-box protein [Methanolinea sp.]
MNTNSFLSQCENLDILPAGIIILGPDYTVVCWNRTIAEWTCIPREKILGRDLREIFPHLADRKYALRIQQVFEGGAAAFFSTQFHPHFIPTPLPGGGLRFQRTTVHAVYEGKETYALVFIDDVTELVQQVRAYRGMRDRALREVRERLEKEAALEESEAKFREIFNSANDAIHIHELREDGLPGRFSEVNAVACEMLGYSREEFLGMTPLDLVQGGHGKPLDVIGREILGKGHAIFETEHKRKDGSTVPVEIHTHRVTIRNRDVVLSVVRDITERKIAEDALALALRKLHLLSTITRHDLLNQVSALKCYIELARDEKEIARTREFLDKMDKVLDTVEEQINFTRDYQEIGVREPAWQNIADIVGKIRAGFQPSGVDIVLALDEIEVYADPLFEKVIFNLFENAFRYGGPSLSLIRVTAAEGPEGLAIAVEDNGVGIPDEDKKHLFRKGFGKHTGLGLFLSREILAITGLSIRETGVPGKGARFEILVPEGKFRRRSPERTGERG